jgi:hypothetical protein
MGSLGQTAGHANTPFGTKVFYKPSLLDTPSYISQNYDSDVLAIKAKLCSANLA